MKKFILIFFIISYSSTASAHWIEALIKAGTEAAAEASAVRAAAKTEKVAQTVNEANIVRKTETHTPTIQVLFATNQMIKECEKAKKNSQNGLCSIQKDKFNTCVEAGLYAGYETEAAIKQCKARLN